MKTIINIILVFIVSLLSITAHASEIDALLKKIELSGLMRTRGWYMGSTIAIPKVFINSDTYKQVYYFDLYARGRINLKLDEMIELRGVFDLSAIYGKNDFSLTGATANIIARNMYAVLKFSKDSELSLGLRPFSLNEGYIFARDAAGVMYQHSFLKKTINAYSALIFAYDNADDSFGSGSDPVLYAGDYIFYVGAVIKPVQNYSVDCYYAIEADEYFDNKSTSERKSLLHWIGVHNKITLGDFFLQISGIINFGTLNIFSRTDIEAEWTNTSTVSILAGLWEFRAGYRFQNFQISLVAEGATGNPADSNAASSFQDIKASHGFSFIAVDNTGGLAVRPSGESPWYGLYGQGIKLQYDPVAEWSLYLYYLHFRTITPVMFHVEESTWFGDEIDFMAMYKMNKTISFFLQAGFLIPQAAYKGLVNHASEALIVDVALGLQIEF